MNRYCSERTRAVATLEAVGVVPLASSGAVADMMGWRDCDSVVLTFNVE
jgi:hypothetical protein